MAPMKKLAAAILAFSTVVAGCEKKTPVPAPPPPAGGPAVPPPSNGGGSKPPTDGGFAPVNSYQGRDVEQWAALLESPNRDEQNSAIMALGRIGPASVPVLRDRLRHKHADVRVAAATAFGVLGRMGADGVPSLALALSDEDFKVRVAAAEALRAMGPVSAPASGALVLALADDAGKVREFAVQALAAIGQPAVPDLVAATRETGRAIRERALNALASMLPGVMPPVEPFREAILEPATPLRLAGVRGLSRMGAAASPAAAELATLLKDADPTVAEIATDALAKIGPSALEHIQKNIAGATPQVRARAFKSMGGCGAAAVPLLKAGLADPESTVRFAAAGALGVIGSAAADAVPALVELLGDPEEGTAGRAVWALGRIGAGAIEYLEGALALPSALARRRACMALGEAGPAAAPAAAAIVRALGDTDAEVRAAAAEAFGKLGPAAAPQAVAALASPDPFTRSAAIRALGASGADSVGALIDVLRKPESLIQRLAAQEALKSIGSPAMLPVAALLRQEDKDLRAAAAEVLGGMGASGVPVLMELLDSQDPELKKLGAEKLGLAGQMGGPAIPALCLLLRDPDAGMRRAAATAIAGIGTKDSASSEACEKGLADVDPVVRAACVMPYLAGCADVSAAVAKIAPLARDPDTRVIASALLALTSDVPNMLGSIGPLFHEVAIPAMADASLNADPEARIAAAVALGVVAGRDPAPVEALVKLGKDKDASVRAAACTAMGGIRPGLAGSAKIVLREALKDPEAAVREAAEASLSKLGD